MGIKLKSMRPTYALALVLVLLGVCGLSGGVVKAQTAPTTTDDSEAYCAKRGLTKRNDCEYYLRKIGVHFFNPLGKDPTGECKTGSGSVATSAESAERERFVWGFFMSKGLTPYQAAGFMGNMKAEAHFEPRLVEYNFLNSRGEKSVAGTPSSLDDQIPPIQTDRGQPGYGIIQWTSPGRRQGLQDLANSKNAAAPTPGDLGVQLDYLWQELNGPYNNSTLIPVMNSSDVASATEIITRHYEIPGNIEATIIVRTEFATEFLAQYGSDPTTSNYKTGVNSTCNATGASLGASNIASKALEYAWPDDTQEHLGLTPKPAYAAAVAKHPEANFNGADSASFVAVVMRDSGADTEYPFTSTAAQESYVRSAKKTDGTNKYTITENSTMGNLLPGDILLVNKGSGACAEGHTIIFVDTQPGGYNKADASCQIRMPNLSTLVNLEDPDGRGHYLTARLN